jgi:hypothetical protein
MAGGDNGNMTTDHERPDKRPDNTGLDDGPPLPGRRPNPHYAMTTDREREEWECPCRIDVAHRSLCSAGTCFWCLRDRVANFMRENEALRARLIGKPPYDPRACVSGTSTDDVGM